MIKKIFLFCLVLIMATPVFAKKARPGCDGDQCQIDFAQDLFFDPANPPSYTEKWLRSIVPGALVGLTTGTVSGMFVQENQNILVTLFIWLCEASVRHSIMRSIEKDFDSGHLSYHKDLMPWPAWLASWIGYLYQRNAL